MIINTVITHLVNILRSEGYDVTSDGVYINKRIKIGPNKGWLSCCVNFNMFRYWLSSKTYEKSKDFTLNDPDIIEALLQVIRQYE